MRYFWLNETTFFIDPGNDLSADNRTLAFAHFQHWLFQNRQSLGEKYAHNLPAILDVVIGYTQITVFVSVDLLLSGNDERLASELTQQLASVDVDKLKPLANPKPPGTAQASGYLPQSQNILRIPVCYHPSLGLDLALCAQQSSMTCENFIQVHTTTTYQVQAVGFAPGFAYLGFVDLSIEQPRHNIPRASVPAGSVGIAGNQTGIYPSDSPGGWKIIGRTPFRCFDPSQTIADASPFTLMRSVQFFAISIEEFYALAE